MYKGVPLPFFLCNSRDPPKLCREDTRRRVSCKPAVCSVDCVRRRIVCHYLRVSGSVLIACNLCVYAHALSETSHRPIRDQRAFYNGHKRKHAIKFQGIVTPDGIVVDLFGPELGTRHDVHLLNESGVLLTLVDNMNNAEGEPYVMYGDPAYGMSTHLNCPYSAESYGPLTAAMLEFNKRMSACRVTVEWVFKEMTGKCAFVSMRNQQKYLLSPVGVQYKVATLLSNIHSCLNGGNEISQYFDCPPPSLVEYLGVDV